MLMSVLGMIARHVTPLNILLAVAVAIAGANIAFPLTRMNYRYKLPQIAQQAVAPEETAAENAAAPLPTDYAVIGEMNLFHPERITPLENNAQLPKPEIILYGTIIDDTQQVAFIEDKKTPVTSPGRGKRQTMVKKGSVISGFTVAEITKDRIVLVRGEERMSVGLMDAEKRKDKKITDKTTSTPPQVPSSVPPLPPSPAGTQPSYKPATAQPSLPPPVPRKTTAGNNTVTPPATPQAK